MGQSERSECMFHNLHRLCGHGLLSYVMGHRNLEIQPDCEVRSYPGHPNKCSLS